MALLHISIFVNLFLAMTIQGWPMQNMNNPPPQPQSWPWMPNNDQDKSIDMPKSMSYPIPSNGMSNFDTMNQQKPFPSGPGPQPEMWSPNGNQDPMMNPDSQFGAEDFPYNRPYRNQFGGQGQQYPMMMQQPPPPQGMPPMHHMNNMYGMPPPQPRSFGGGQGMMNPNRVGGRSTNSPPEFYPQTSPFDFLNPRYPIEYSPLKQKNTSAITIHYNVTYTFSPMGWKPIDVSVSDADFHSSISDKAIDVGVGMGMPLMTPGGGIMPIPSNEMKNPDQGPGPMSGWWWPKKTGSEIDDKIPSGIDQPEIMPTGFGKVPPTMHA